MASAKARRDDVDTVRGIACMLLVLFHVVGNNPATGLRLPFEHPYAQANQMLVYFRMPMFAFLSGLVYALRPFDGDVKGFVSGKFRRLIIPMLIVGTVFAILQAAVPGTNAAPIDWRTIHIIPVAHFWFLESMFICFMVVAALDHFDTLSSSLRCALVVVAFATLTALASGTEIKVLGIGGAIYLMPFVLTGIWYSRHVPAVSRPVALGLLLACVLALAAYAQASESRPSKQSLLALASSAVFCVGLMKLRLRVVWLAWIGGFSFAIYLFHSMFSAAARIGMKAAFGTAVSLPVMVLVGLLAGVVGPVLVATLLDRWNWGRWVLGESPRTPASRPSESVPASERAKATADPQ